MLLTDNAEDFIRTAEDNSEEGGRRQIICRPGLHVYNGRNKELRSRKAERISKNSLSSDCGATRP